MDGLGVVSARIREARRLVPATRSLLVAVSGIDGSGKGHVAARIAAALEAAELRAAVINIDGWLNLPHLRFDPFRPAAHFYERAIRFEALFERLVLPLRHRRSVRLLADFAEETATSYRPHLYEFRDVDVILLEGIFLLKPEHRPLYDLTVWVDCSFETALERAIARAQEGLSPAATVRTYETIYFAAQRLHARRDNPRSAADMVVVNDPALAKFDATRRNPASRYRIEERAGPQHAASGACRPMLTAPSEGEEGAVT